MPATRLTTDWHQVNIHFKDHHFPERPVASVIGPRLDQLETQGAVSGWWFMRKPPGCRIRLQAADTAPIDEALNHLTAAGAIAGWKPAIYEPETTAFGGAVGMDVAHKLFCSDTRGFLTYLREPNPPLGRRELSVLLVSAMLAAAGLDWFERGDVFARVAAMRPAPEAGTEAQRAQLTEQLGTLLAVPASSTSKLFGPGLSDVSALWLAAFEVTGRRFADAADQGVLGRGIRAVLAHVVIFHWNRLGPTTSTQAILARAATDAYLPKD